MQCNTVIDGQSASLSARRAWIEKIILGGLIFIRPVALRKESVDRKVSAFDVLAVSAGRSPQGERG